LAWIVLALVVAVVISPWLGAETIDLPRGVVDWIAGEPSRDARILSLRLPRVALGLLAGGALGLAGAAFQTLLRNALATPYTLGVSFAGALGAFLSLSIPALSFRWGSLSSTALLAFLFAAVDVAVLYALARRRGRLDTHELLLAGVTLNFFCGACILLLRFLTDPLRLRAMDHWMMGGLQVSGWAELVMVPLLVAPAAVLVMHQAAALDQLGFGEELAAARGVHVARTQRVVLLGGSLLTAAVVSVTGPIGFVGLLAPHAVRRLLGPRHGALLPGAFLMGGAFLVLADAGARSLDLLGRGAELPVGILTALAGAPLFLFLLVRSRSSNW
jgi:iron complex transport system permease protein